MAAINIPGAYLLTVQYQQGGQLAASVLGVKGDVGGWIGAQKAQEILNSWWAAIRNVCPTDVVCTGGEVRAAVPDGQVVALTAPPSPAGNGTGSTGLPALSALVKWSTQQGGRSGKGRTFLPCAHNGIIANGGRAWTPAGATAVTTAISAYLGSIAWTAPYSPAVLSRKNGQAYAIVSGSLAPVPAVQRRRMR